MWRTNWFWKTQTGVGRRQSLRPKRTLSTGLGRQIRCLPYPSIPHIQHACPLYCRKRGFSRHAKRFYRSRKFGSPENSAKILRGQSQNDLHRPALQHRQRQLCLSRQIRRNPRRIRQTRRRQRPRRLFIARRRICRRVAQKQQRQRTLSQQLAVYDVTAPAFGKNPVARRRCDFYQHWRQRTGTTEIALRWSIWGG